MLWVVGSNFTTLVASARKNERENSYIKLSYEHDECCDLHSKIDKPSLVLKSFMGMQKHAE